MSVSQLYIVDELKQKIQNLADRLQLEKTSNSKLNSYNTELEEKLKEQDTLIKELKQENNTLKLSKAFVSENGGAQEAKLQINKIVREIDRCIALLNR